jgi:CBS domain-containing protein
MKASEIMTTGVECIAPDTKVLEAAKKMKKMDVGFLPVCDNDRLIGTVTDRDIVLRVLAEGRPIRKTVARDVMTQNVFWCYEDDNVNNVARKMQEKEVRRMLILNKEKRLAGVISIGDIAKAQGEESMVGETVKHIAEAPSRAA